jgi:hypothetical protein
MQSKLRYLSVAALSVAILFTSCIKDKTAKDYSTELNTHNDDQGRVSSEMDAVNDDVNLVVESDPAFSGRIASICDATVAVDTFSNPRTITVTYNGTNCTGRHTRTGVVVVSMPAGSRWRDVGAVLTINYQNLKITRVADNKSITLNGTQTLTNVSGGRMIDLPNRANIIHDHNSTNMSIKFDDNTVRNWNVARRRVFTYNNGIVVSVHGTHNNGTYANIEEWGTDRFGNAFSSAITQPVVFRQDCSFRVTGGQMVHRRQGVEATISFGLDASGNPTGCPGTAAYYYKITWVGVAGNLHTVIHPY